MRIARFRIPELALLAALLTLHGPLALSQQPPAPRPVPIPPGYGSAAVPPQQAAPSKPVAPEEGDAPVAARPAARPAEAGAAPAPQAVSGEGSIGGLNLQNVSLTEVIDFLARRLKINYVLDKGVSGGVTLNTYGDVKGIDERALLDTILRINGAAMVQTGDVYRIVLLNDLAHMPLRPQVDPKQIADDDKPMLNLVFLKYANVEELSKLIGEFLGPAGRAWSYPPANLLLVLDSQRSMRRTMDLISLFDSDTLAKQRVKLFDVKNSRPSDLSKELETLLKSMSLSKELSSVKFVPVDRINTLIAVAPNPGVFDQIREWIDRLDVKVKSAAGKTDTYVYRVKYGQAGVLAMSIMMLYYSMMGAINPMMMGGFGGMGLGGMGYGGMGYGGMGYGSGQMAGGQTVAGQQMAGGGAGGASASSSGADMTGSYLGMGSYGMFPGMGMKGPRVVPNPTDNSLLILGTGEEYESILRILRELDIPPRQVLIEARIFEVRLTGAFSWGLAYYLQNRSAGTGSSLIKGTTGGFINSALSLTSAAVVSESKELLALLSTQDLATKTKMISAPSVIATDSIAASINVGADVPTLTSQAVTGAQQNGNSLFANTISNRQTGVTLGITARVNPSGIVTLMINQQVSSPQAPPVGGIQSPSFSTRSVSTQVTVQDGDMVAIGGIINETDGETSTGIPYLHRIPGLGFAFGNKSKNRERTEMVIFMTPRVIYDTNDIADAGQEIVSGMKRIQKQLR